MALHLVRPAKSAMSENQPPVRRKNSDVRSREYLTEDEVARLVSAAQATGRKGLRDALLIGTMFRHALRVSEVVALTWEQVHFGRSCTLDVTRVKRGVPSTHYLAAEEIRTLKRWRAASPESRFVFASERGTPVTVRTVHNIVQRAGEAAGFEFSIHPHMLRHSKGYQLANRGTDTRAIQGYLGHRRIESTVTYTTLDPHRFKGFED